MAITATALTVTNDERTAKQANRWAVNGYSADLSSCEELKAAPGVATEALYITRLSISCASAITVTIGAGETGGAVTAVLIGPIEFTAEASHAVIPIDRPIKLADATALVVDSSGAGNVCVFVEGFTQ